MRAPESWVVPTIQDFTGRDVARFNLQETVFRPPFNGTGYFWMSLARNTTVTITPLDSQGHASSASETILSFEEATITTFMCDLRPLSSFGMCKECVSALKDCLGDKYACMRTISLHGLYGAIPYHDFS